MRKPWLCAGLIAGLSMITPIGSTALAEVSGQRARVAAAFEAVRQGDASRVGMLVDEGRAIVPAVMPFVVDDDAEVRREALAVLDAIGGPDAARAALAALADPSTENAALAAGVVYAAVIRDGSASVPGLATALAKTPARDEPSAALLLLNAFGGHPDRVRLSLAETRLVAIREGEPVVEAGLPAAMALARRGDRDGVTALRKRIDRGTLEDLEFMLRAIGVIDSAGTLQALAMRTLGDTREIGDGLPSGVTPRRRIADLAVEAFSSRLRLQSGVETRAVKRYSTAEISRVRAAILASTPR